MNFQQKTKRNEVYEKLKISMQNFNPFIYNTFTEIEWKKLLILAENALENFINQGIPILKSKLENFNIDINRVV